MLTMIEDWVGPDNAPYVIWAGLAVAALLLALLIFLLFRRSLSGTYVAGGRNRRPRLAVLDAAAVDAKRRLVLVRRDETEHLILIGGPTDVVVESGIRPGGMPAPRPAAVPAQAAAQRRPVPPGAQPVQRPVAPPQPAAVQPPPPPVTTYPAPPPARPTYPAPPPVAPARPSQPAMTEPAVEVRREVPAAKIESEPPPAPEPKPAGSPFKRFFGSKTPPSTTPEKEPPPPAPKVDAKADAEVDRSLEEEMTKLLEEISDPKK